jgi:monoamine oxidase
MTCAPNTRLIARDKHFAGEHTSFAFVGYLGGALSSGYRLARRLYDYNLSKATLGAVNG